MRVRKRTGEKWNERGREKERKEVRGKEEKQRS